jgi:glycine/D-amino acid oxidase-like deaminating enzyme
VIRSNYLTSEGVRFYAESVRMFQNLSNEFDFNIMYSERGQLTLAHTDATVRSFRQRAEVNKHFGGRTEMIDRQQIRELVPSLNLDPGHLPVLAGLAHRRRHRAPRRRGLGLRQAGGQARRGNPSTHRSAGPDDRNGASGGQDQPRHHAMRLRGAGRAGPVRC